MGHDSKEKEKEKEEHKRPRAEGEGEGEGGPPQKRKRNKERAEVDSECPRHHAYRVIERDDIIYDSMLNLTDIAYSLKGHNKFIILQALQDTKHPSKCYYWQRWGRVGMVGQSKLDGPLTMDKAIDTFCQKFHDKTGNDFRKQDEFKAIKGKYDMVQIDHTASEEVEEEIAESQEHPEQAEADSKLPVPVRSLVELIFNVRQMEQAMIDLNYDAKKAPLGKLTTEQIRIGYECLKKVEGLVNTHKKGKELVEACNEYYTKVPHDFGMHKPPLIETPAMVKREMDLLEALGDIEIAMKKLSENAKKKSDVSPIDQNYESLNCSMKALPRGSAEYEVIEKYMKQSHGHTHKDYTLDILDAFEVEREEETRRFKDVGNKVLLWHGSRTTNYVGILSNGLRIAPPEAPVTGYMYGKGVYFADCSTKSANYAHTTKKNNTGLLLLCEVSLGESVERIKADSDAPTYVASHKKHSVKALGRTAPDPNDFTMLGDVKVPWGKGVPTGVKNPDGYTLQYNEYIVYNVEQYRIRYLLKCKFNHR